MKTSRIYFALKCLALCPLSPAQGQQSHAIVLQNPSFESETYQDYALPLYWNELNPSLKTPNRLHPFYNLVPKIRKVWDSEENSFVNVPAMQDVWQKLQKPAHGSRFTSLLTSDLGQKQSLTQAMERTLQLGHSYTFSLQLAWAPNFWQTEEGSDRPVNYNNPLCLKIWGGNAENHKVELLATTTTVSTKKWKKYFFVFKPSQTEPTHLTFEADFAPEICFLQRKYIARQLFCHRTHKQLTPSIYELEETASLTLRIHQNCKQINPIPINKINNHASQT